MTGNEKVATAFAVLGVALAITLRQAFMGEGEAFWPRLNRDRALDTVGNFLQNIVLSLYDMGNSLRDAEWRLSEKWRDHPFLGPFYPTWIENFDLRLVGVTGSFLHRRSARR